MIPSKKETFETYSNVTATDLDLLKTLPGVTDKASGKAYVEYMDAVERAVREARDQGEAVEVGMTIDENSLHHIMTVLSSLYSDPKTAILREYSTNAHDSHIQSGNPAPIQVSTPTPLYPMLKIQDFGVGLNAEDMVFVYSKYGLSTKTDTNDLNGVLGFGCKSAFAYTNQFTVTGVKNGVKTVCLVKRDEEGIGRITIMDQLDTDETNGVTIEIPPKRGDNFLQEAERLFRYWPEGSVLLNDEEPECYDGLKITDNITLVKNDNHTHYDYTTSTYVTTEQNIIVMGNVPYPVDTAQFDFKLAANYFVIARVPIGAVHFAPSREALQYTTRTKQALEAVMEELQQGLVDAVNQEIKAAADAPTALRVALRWRSVLPKVFREQSFTYKGVEIPDSIEVANSGQRFIVADGKKQKDYYGKPSKVGHHSRHQAIELVTVPGAIWVYNFKRTFTPVVKKKLWHYCDKHNTPYPENFIMCEDKPTSPWIESDRMLLWDSIELIKLPRISRSTGRDLTGRLPSSYDMFLNVDGDTTWDIDTPADDIDTEDLSIFYSMGNQWEVSQQGERLGKILDDFVIVQLTPNRVAKFCRLFPGAQSYHDAMVEYAKEWYSFLSSTDINLLSMFNSGEPRLSFLDEVPQLVADPELRKAKRLKDFDPGYWTHLQRMYHVFVDVVQVMRIPEWKNPMAKYPLFKQAYYSDNRKEARRHNRIYLNAAYEALYATQEGAN